MYYDYYKIKTFLFVLVILCSSKNFVLADNNFLNVNFNAKDVKNIKKIWTYHSGIYKDTQTKGKLYKDKIIFLDGHKNLIVISLSSGKEICKNLGLKDTKPMRGIGIYKKNSNEIYAVFVRNNHLIQININTCKKKYIKKNFYLPSVVAPILVKGNNAYILKNNGKPPVSVNLDNYEVTWEARIQDNIKIDLVEENSNNELKWNVWGGGVIDYKNNQLIFSTANPKPGFVSNNRLGKNFFHNSIVSIDLDTGLYNWHFQEIEHDLLNLDLASPPILLSLNTETLKKKDYVVQATKTGQLILLDLLTGKPSVDIKTKEFYPYKNNVKIKTVRKYFPEWLTYSKSNFKKDDINTLNFNFSKRAKKIINKSIISEYKALERDKDYIFYGMHGGTEWPYIASTIDGIIVVPSNNIAWIARLNDSYYKQYLRLIKQVFSFNSHSLTEYLKKIKRILLKIKNYNPSSIQEYKKFETSEGIPLNSTPWGTLTAIDIKNKKKIWSIPHGTYPNLDNKFTKTGSEIFGSPAIAGNVVFMSGTIDKKIYAYDIVTGKMIWNDDLPFVSYGNLIITEYDGNNYLIINASGGSKMSREKNGDALIAYLLN